MSKIFDTILDGIIWYDQTYIVMFYLIICKREVPWSKRDTNRVSAKNTPILKSVRNTNEQAKKQSFDKEISQYLSEWGTPLFIGVFHGFGFSGDPNELYSE